MDEHEIAAVLERMKKYRCRTKRPELLKALRMIEEISINAFCDCHKDLAPGEKRFCPTCEIYVIVHGALGCGGSRTCPVMKSGRRQIKEFRRRE